MRLFVLIGAVVTAASSLPLYGQAPVARLGTLMIPDPAINTGIISSDGAGGVVAKIQQCEVRSIGGGIYRIAATVNLRDPLTGTAFRETELITGSLDLTVSPPVWLPKQDVAALNQAATMTDEYQVSMSSDGLTVVWDRYVATTFPNTGLPSQTFCCHRASTAVPFAVGSVRSISGVGVGGVDPHIGEELPNGHVILYHIGSVNGTQAAPIVRGDLDPLTGTLGPTSVVATYHGAGVGGYNHSPFVFRDSTGKARALCFSEFPANGPQNSNAVFTEGVNDDGTPEIVLDGSLVPQWFNNPGLVGGTWHYCTSGQTEPQLQEVTMLANTDLTSGSGRIAAWTPARPRPGSGSFLSVVGLGIDVGTLSIPPYQIAGVTNSIWIVTSLGITDVRTHDQYTGLAEWVFPAVPPLNTVLTMQLVTLDTGQNTIFASNTARLNL
jgi:hypothetical protein